MRRSEFSIRTRFDGQRRMNIRYKSQSRGQFFQEGVSFNKGKGRTVAVNQ